MTSFLDGHCPFIAGVQTETLHTPRGILDIHDTVCFNGLVRTSGIERQRPTNHERVRIAGDRYGLRQKTEGSQPLASG